MAIRKPKVDQPIQRYGIPATPFNENQAARNFFGPQFHYDLAAFGNPNRVNLEHSGVTRLDLYRRISDAYIPGYHEWHEWTERQIEGILSHRWTGFCGCGSSSKTHNVAGFAVAWWLAAPQKSSVILCCTSISALRKKLWACLRKAYQSLPEPVGNFLDSRRVWQCESGNDKYAIQGVAVEEGSPIKVADNIKGHHTERLLIVLDEGTSIPSAIMDACSNMWAYPSGCSDDFHLVMMFNPRSHLDQAGRFSEPKNGWSSINVETEEWDTVPQMDGRSGRILRFDALKSPNLKSYRIISRHLPRREEVEAAMSRPGADNTPSFWSNFRGFWAPEGIELTVFSESLLVQHHAYDHWTFLGETTIVGGFDPAYTSGGDEAIFSPARIGMTASGMAIEFLPNIPIPLSATSSNPITYQLAEGLRSAAEKVGCEPRHLVVDGSATGLCDVLQRQWSPEIIRVMNQGRASELPISYEDARLGCDVYQNKRVELYFQMREYLCSDQLRGLDKESATELITATYEPEGGGSRRKMEAKKDMKIRLGRSPDHADARAGCVEAARRAGVKIKAVGFTQNQDVDWEKQVSEAQDAVTEDQYQPQNEAEADYEIEIA